MKKADNFYTYRPFTMQQSAQTIYLKKNHIEHIFLPALETAWHCTVYCSYKYL